MHDALPILASDVRLVGRQAQFAGVRVSFTTRRSACRIYFNVGNHPSCIQRPKATPELRRVLGRLACVYLDASLTVVHDAADSKVTESGSVRAAVVVKAEPRGRRSRGWQSRGRRGRDRGGRARGW